MRLVQSNILWNGPDAGRRNAGCQDQAIAIQNAAPVRRQLKRAGEPNLALLLEEVVGEHLDIGRPRSQPDKRERNGRHNELAAPYRRATGQQWTGGVLNAAAH